METLSGYTIAWLVIAGTALAGGLCLHRLLRGLPWPTVRWLCVLLVVTFFVVPAPVPRIDQGIAPAFVIALFEALFQNAGEPALSLWILAGSLATVTVIVLIAARLIRK